MYLCIFHDKYKALYNSVSTSEDELRLLSANTSSLDLVTPDLIKRCISKLKSGKGDGNESFTSDHLINSCSRLHSVLALLFRSIIYHGHYPDNLLKSTIISIPKDAKASLSNVDNYRGISLSNSCNVQHNEHFSIIVYCNICNLCVSQLSLIDDCT